MAAGDYSKLALKFIAKPLVPRELLPPVIWLVKGVLLQDFLTVLKGLPGSIKTYEALSMALCIQTGRPWCGRRTKQANVLLISPDDPDGPRIRGQAWCKLHGVDREVINGVMFDIAVNLHKQDEVEQAAENILRQGLKPDLIIWDTLFHNTLGADLTQPKDTLPIFDRERWLMKEVGARTGLTLHHTPKDGIGFFGSVSLEGTVDVILHSKKTDKNTAILSCERMRRGSQFDPIEIKLASIQVETLPDDEGVNQFEEMVVVTATAAPTAETSTKTNKDDQLDFMIWRMLLGFYEAGDVGWLQFTKWFEVAKAARGETGLGNSTFSASVNRLLQNGRIRVKEDGKHKFYQVVFGAGSEGEGGEDGLHSSSLLPTPQLPAPHLRGGELGSDHGAAPRNPPGAGSDNGGAGGARRNQEESVVAQTDPVNGETPKPGIDPLSKAEELLNRRNGSSDAGKKVGT